MDKLLEVMRRLRAPDGCPWDREQTHLSLREYMLEEAAEAVDAMTGMVEAGDDPQELVGELGDVLLQVAFHSVIAEETNAFSYESVQDAILDKLIRRHPHIFGTVSVSGSDEVVTNWQAIKAQERAGKPQKHPAERVPRALGALARAGEVAKALEMPKGSKQDVLRALEHAGDDARGISSVLEAVVAWARGAGVNAEIALRERTDQHVRDAVSEAQA
jgi:XTP/dITP diphosphohydrolase